MTWYFGDRKKSSKPKSKGKKPKDARLRHAESLTLPNVLAQKLQNGALTLLPQWSSLSQAASQAPKSSGLYAIGFPLGIEYDGGNSRIIYIGSSENLSHRLKTHSATSHNWAISEVRRLRKGKLLVTWWTLPPVHREWLLALEGEAICSFERHFGTVPICNLGLPESSVAKVCRDLVKIVPCSDVSNSMNLDEMAKQLSEVRVRKLFRPYGVGTNLTANEAFFMSKGDKEKRVLRVAQFAKERQLEQLTYVTKEHVADWSIDKFVALLRLCGQLERDGSPRATSVARFFAQRPDVPLPHSWGEVALVKARSVAGVWRPNKKVWLKVLHGKLLLGQAVLEPYGWFNGEDKSDLPQITIPRRSFWETVIEQEEGDEINDEWEDRDLVDCRIEPAFLEALRECT
jgi:hypothetical protein